MATETEIKQVYNEMLGRDPDPSGLKTYSSIGKDDIIRSIQMSDEFAQTNVRKLYMDILGREPDPGGLQSWSENYKRQIISGRNPNDIYTDIQNGMRQSPEYEQGGGELGEDNRDLINTIEFAQQYPEFKWGSEEENRALAYAEAKYGPYYSQMLSDYMETVKTRQTRTDEDYQTALQQSQASLQDYLTKSESDKQRINEDFTQAYGREAQNLGLDLTKIYEDKRRQTEDFGITTENIDRNYAKLIPQVVEKYSDIGRAFSGERATEQQFTQESQVRDIQAVGRSYERNLADLQRNEQLRNQEHQRYIEDIVKLKEQGLSDIEAQTAIAQRKAQEYQQGLGTTKTRTLQDIENERKQQERSITEQKQEQVYGGYWGVGTQQARAEQNYTRQQQQYYESYPRIKSTGQVLGGNMGAVYQSFYQ